MDEFRALTSGRPVADTGQYFMIDDTTVTDDDTVHRGNWPPTCDRQLHLSDGVALAFPIELVGRCALVGARVLVDDGIEHERRVAREAFSDAASRLPPGPAIGWQRLAFGMAL